MEKIIKLLKKDARMSIEDIAAATDYSTSYIKETFAKMEKEGIILGYAPILNLENTNIPHVTALVDIKFSLNDKIGFEELCKKIALMPEVDSVHLVSGGYDLCAVLSGKNIQDIAFYVNEKLSSMECVLSTTTHFVLKTYKECGHIVNAPKKDRREVML